MYFPAVIAPKTIHTRAVLWPHYGKNKGTCMVIRDNFKEGDTIEHMLHQIFLTIPDTTEVQEIKLSLSEVDYV